MKAIKTADEVVQEIVEELRHADGETIEKIANMVCVPQYTYIEDSLFEHDVEE